jgi:hypothetical protein
MLFLYRTLYDDQDATFVVIIEEAGSGGAVLGGTSDVVGFLPGSGGVKLGGTSAVLQIVSCRKPPIVYGQRSKFDQKGGSRKPAHLACITVKHQGLNYTI